MTTTFEEVRDEAITMARVTGSVGATMTRDGISVRVRRVKPRRKDSPCPNCTVDANGLTTGYARGGDPMHPHRCEECRGTGVDRNARDSWEVVS